jgi:Fungal specific transcription factor domain
MVRLAVELGLHHDPSDQVIFTPEESQLRMRLWSICVMHDRDTSIIFGRPLAIQRADFNTAAPSRFIEIPGSNEPTAVFSEHVDISAELVHIQAEVINSLYRPGILTGEQVVLRAIDVERSLEQWRRKLPPIYQKLFTGHSHLDMDQRVNIVTSTINTDRGITMLKYGILRMCLLRAVFNNKTVSAHLRYKSLHDGEFIVDPPPSLGVYIDQFFLIPHSRYHGTQCACPSCTANLVP